MASPMRKKRAWSTREDDAESKETAAFEATVAAAKDTAAKSGAFLSSANEDLTDHHRWLRAQSAAVERDRHRHERWLQRQRDQRLALAKKERVRRRRQLMRQRAMLATRGAIVAGLLFVRSWIAFAFAKIGAGFKFVGTLIGRGFASIGRQIATGTRWIGAKLGMAASEAGRGLSAGSSLIASKIGTGLSAAGAKSSVLAGATGRTASSGFSHLAAKASELGAASKRGLASGYRWSRTRATAASPAVYTQLAKFGRRAEHFARTRAAGAERISPAEVQTPPAASVHVIEVYGPHKKSVELFGRRANDPWTPASEAPQNSGAAEVYGPFYEGFWVEGASPNEPHAAPPLGSRAGEESALSSWGGGARGRGGAFATQARIAAGQAGAWTWTHAGRAGAWAGAQPWAKTESWARAKARAETWARTRDVDLSQMMIIAGAVLLVCGGLLVSGGLLMRAGARTTTVADIAPEETFSGITWTFNEPDLPLPQRAVFTLSGTPESFRINGLSVSGVNNSDRPLTGLQGVLKPDVQRPDLRLSLQVDEKISAGEGAAQQTPVVAPGTVPAHTPFRLVFPFPPEAMGGEDGITVDEFFDSYGGLLLKLRYEIEGVEKSVIQYLGPDLLKGQLDEVSAPVAGG